MPAVTAFADLRSDPSLSVSHEDVTSGLDGFITVIERQLACRVTIHDLAGELILADGTHMLDEQRGFHLHDRCLAVRRDSAEGGRRCLAHCMRACGARAAGSQVAFRQACWADLTEVVIPVWWGGRHRATVFLGPWPMPLAPGSATLETAVVLGRALGDVLMTTAQRVAQADGSGDRRLMVQASARSCESLAHVAARLGLSTSRASRVIHALCGQPWRSVLREERLRRARRLLSVTDQSCADIAAQLGYATPGHFSRCFRRAEGVAPGAWRAGVRA